MPEPEGPANLDSAVPSSISIRPKLQTPDEVRHSFANSNLDDEPLPLPQIASKAKKRSGSASSSFPEVARPMALPDVAFSDSDNHNIANMPLNAGPFAAPMVAAPAAGNRKKKSVSVVIADRNPVKSIHDEATLISTMPSEPDGEPDSNGASIGKVSQKAHKPSGLSDVKPPSEEDKQKKRTSKMCPGKLWFQMRKKLRLPRLMLAFRQKNWLQRSLQ
ncbi:MAG: hypothetical protein GY822_05075 [Deltaproteobacteria bacterium]|nr:hypothetical protein [Deltaproteobacteria bacterium]